MWRTIRRLGIVAVLFAGLLVNPGPAQAQAQAGCTLIGPGFNVEAENYPLPPTISGMHYYSCANGNNIPLDIVIENTMDTPSTGLEWTIVATGRGQVCIACKGTTAMLWRINGGKVFRIACNY